MKLRDISIGSKFELLRTGKAYILLKHFPDAVGAHLCKVRACSDRAIIKIDGRSKVKLITEKRDDTEKIPSNLC